MDRVSRLLDTFTGPGVAHRPQRGDEVAQWLKNQRDVFPHGTPAWTVLDDLLDLYRLHADTGTPLHEHACDAFCDCETSARA